MRVLPDELIGNRTAKEIQALFPAIGAVAWLPTPALLKKSTFVVGDTDSITLFDVQRRPALIPIRSRSPPNDDFHHLGIRTKDNEVLIEVRAASLNPLDGGSKKGSLTWFAL